MDEAPTQHPLGIGGAFGGDNYLDFLATGNAPSRTGAFPPIRRGSLRTQISSVAFPT